jgi:hypothetical protein
MSSTVLYYCMSSTVLVLDTLKANKHEHLRGNVDDIRFTPNFYEDRPSKTGGDDDEEEEEANDGDDTITPCYKRREVHTKVIKFSFLVADVIS